MKTTVKQVALLTAMTAAATACGDLKLVPDRTERPMDLADDESRDAGDDPDAKCKGGWRDAATNLCWEDPPPETYRNWEEALSYCEERDLGGHTDWRLPTISELRSLIRGCPGPMTGGDCAVAENCASMRECWTDACNGCNIGDGPENGCYRSSGLSGDCHWYWSSSPVANNANFAWYVGFDYGNVDAGVKGSGYRVRCVRAGP